MGFKDLPLKLKVLWLRRLQNRDARRRQKKKPSWITPVSHGYYTVNRFKEPYTDSSSDTDLVLVQREQIEDLEAWFFGVSETQIGNGIAKYMQTHLFDNFPSESEIMRKTKETMRKAHMGVRAKITATPGEDEKQRIVGSAASVLVVNGEMLAMANVGGHRVVISRDGDAHQIRNKNLRTAKRHLSQMIFLRSLTSSCNPRNGEDEANSRSSELAVVAERISSDTEFIIVASSGIWEVMKNQEAVNLIRHIEDPQRAARCLAKEALNRMSKSSISCIVIRFD